MDFNEPKAFDASLRSQHPVLFDVCHVGVVLRVVLGVQIVSSLAVSFQAQGLGDALSRWTELTVATLAASLLWLIGACLLQRPLQRASELVRWAFAAVWGASVALVAYAIHTGLMFLMGRVAGEPSWVQVPTALTGAVMGAVCMAWLKQRSRSALPAQAAARLAELQARIRPHFLFNTLNTAIALVQVDPPRAEAVLEDLAELFRQALASPQGSTTLADEVALAKRYLDIEQLRFGERMRLHWHLDALCDATLVPALILQPLVENAVRHGVEPSAAGGWIEVRTQAQGDHMVLVVRNTVPSQSALPFTVGHGMALDNVRQRLQLMHDVQLDFHAGLKAPAASGEPAMFEVRVRVPRTQEVSA